MALTQEDVEAIGRVIQTRITEYDQGIRAEINQAFTQTGEAFEMRLMQVIEQEREMFFEALRQIMEQVTRLTTMLEPEHVPNPHDTAVAPEDVPDDALGEDVVDDRVPAPPTKGVVTNPPFAAPSTPITPSVFGDGR